MPGTHPLVTVEPVESRTQLRRFAEVPFGLHHTDDRWSAGVRVFEQWRLDARRHPYFDRGDAAYLLARRAGRPAGRIAAHVDGSADGRGWFGFFDVDDDAGVARALVDAAATWLVEQGATSMTGPVSWTPEEGFGVLVEGFDHPARTGLAWHPPWYAEHLEGLGLGLVERRPTHRISVDPAVDPAVRLAAGPVPDDPGTASGTRPEPPPHAGPYGDPALVLDGIAAVPDVSGLLSQASVRSAWRLARAARSRAFDTAVCVRCDDEPTAAVPRLVAACAAAGYATLLAPWSPRSGSPERVHATFGREL